MLVIREEENEACAERKEPVGRLELRAGRPVGLGMVQTLRSRRRRHGVDSVASISAES